MREGDRCDYTGRGSGYCQSDHLYHYYCGSTIAADIFDCGIGGQYIPDSNLHTGADIDVCAENSGSIYWADDFRVMDAYPVDRVRHKFMV